MTEHITLEQLNSLHDEFTAHGGLEWAEFLSGVIVHAENNGTGVVTIVELMDTYDEYVAAGDDVMAESIAMFIEDIQDGQFEN